METIIPPQVGMRLRTKKRGHKKREGPKNKKNKKEERKIEKGKCCYPFTTLVLQSSTMIFMTESLLFCHFHILVRIFHYRTWLVYSNDGLPQIALGLRELSFFLSFHTLIALVHLLHGNPYSLTLISIDGYLHSPLRHLVDVRISPSFCLLHNHHILIHHSAISMAHAHVLREGGKSLRLFKYETIAWLVIGGIEVGNIFV